MKINVITKKTNILIKKGLFILPYTNTKLNLYFQEVESGNESAPEQLSRENSATEFGRGEDQVQKPSTSMEEHNQYKVYFYDPKESFENSSISSGNLRSCIPSQSQPYITCKRGDVSGYIMIGT